MRESLLRWLVEPGTGAELRLEVERRQGEVIESGTLVSVASGRRYPVINGIPRFVGDDNYAGSFGMQWNRFREVQLDSRNGAHFSRDRFDAETGWTEADLGGRLLLDAGCGAGRFAEIAAARGAQVIALDYSSAVDAAGATLARFPNAEVVQGDLLAPPLRRHVFDFAYCIGVVQHTPSPSLVVANVVACLKPGGRFGFTIYARRPWTKLNAKYLVRPLTRRLSAPTLLGAIERAMPVLFPLTDRLFRVPLVGRLAQFAIPVATYVDKPGFSDEQRYREAILDTFDMLSPRYDAPMTWREVETVLSGAAASWTFRSRVPINVTGQR